MLTRKRRRARVPLPLKRKSSNQLLQSPKVKKPRLQRRLPRMTGLTSEEQLID